MPARLRFLQISDVHFGAPLRGGRLGLSEAAIAMRAQERRQVFARAIGLVAERDLDGVLLPGDLFDDEAIDRDSLRFVQHLLASIAPKPVFVTPGNHDPFGGASPYNARRESSGSGLRWPDNVILFAHEEFRGQRWPGRDDVDVFGAGVRANEASGVRRLARRIERPSGPSAILLFHGSRDDGQWLQAHKSTYPFSRQELLAQGFDWVALGHYHGMQILHDEQGRARAAYSGCPFAGGLDEQGEKGALIVELGADAAQVEFVRLDQRRVHDLRCDLSGCEFAEQAIERAESALAAATVQPDDLVLLRLCGRLQPGLELAPLSRLAEQVFHLRLDAGELRPDVDLARYPELGAARTVEERFVASLRAAVQGGDAVAGRALLYGLDALQHGRLESRYEDLR